MVQGKAQYKSNFKVSMKLDSKVLDMMIAYLFTNSTYINRGSLMNMKHLIEAIDERMYMTDDSLRGRFDYIKKALQARVELNLDNPLVLLNYCKTGNTQIDESMRPIVEGLTISTNEILWINTMVADRLKYAFIFKYKDELIECIDKLESGDFDSLKSINVDFKNVITMFANDIRKVESREKSELEFSLDEENFLEVVKYVVDKLSAPTNKLNLGIQALNDMMNGGPEAGRLYLFLGLAGGFKSGTLLSIANWIKKYNTKYVPKDPSKRPAVLFITMENTLEETVERLFNMTVTPTDIRNYTPEEVIKMLKENGQLTLSDESNIDIIIRYYPNKSISTANLYSIINDLEDNGIETIALILDYIKRIRPTEKANDLRLELGNVSDELKVIAQHFDIPVITASQLNREGARTVDAAVEGNKSDIVRLLGRSNIGESWNLIENSDWVKYTTPLHIVIYVENFFNCWELLLLSYRDNRDNQQPMHYISYTYTHSKEILVYKIIVDDVKDYYTIDEYGNINSSRTNKILRHCISNKGYHDVVLSSQSGPRKYGVHRLVALTFIPNPMSLPTVNHIDGDKDNNHVSNLEWASYASNNIHALQTGLRNTFGENQHASIYTDAIIHDICSMIESNEPRIDIISRYSDKYSHTQLNELYNRIKRREAWTHIAKQYKWENDINHYDDAIIHRICQLIVDGMSNTDIIKLLNMYDDMKIRKRMFSLLFDIRNKKSRLDISIHYDI